MATYDVNGKVALVTGGGSGIGEACAVTLAGSGAKVVVADVNPDAAKRVAAAMGTRPTRWWPTCVTRTRSRR